MLKSGPSVVATIIFLRGVVSEAAGVPLTRDFHRSDGAGTRSNIPRSPQLRHRQSSAFPYVTIRGSDARERQKGGTEDWLFGTDNAGRCKREGTATYVHIGFSRSCRVSGRDAEHRGEPFLMYAGHTLHVCRESAGPAGREQSQTRKTKATREAAVGRSRATARSPKLTSVGFLLSALRFISGSLFHSARPLLCEWRINRFGRC